MLESITRKQKHYFLNQKKFRHYDWELRQWVQILNKKSILSISGLKYSWTTELAREIVIKTSMWDSFFYFNPHVDTYWTIQNDKSLILLMDYSIRTWNDIKIVILEDCNTIGWIKKFILDLYKSKNFKIIILWNNIKIDWVDEIQIKPLSLNWVSQSKYIYWWLPHVRVMPDKNFKQVLLDTIICSIIDKEVSIPYNVKNTQNFRKVLSYLAGTQERLSLREIHRHLEEHKIHISLITLIEYINIALTTKILYKLEEYDFKKKQIIHTRVLYHFSDIWIRSSLSSYDSQCFSNIISNELALRWYTLYSWKNGTFVLDIYAIKWDTSIGVHYSDSEDKNTIRKLARKLSKVPSLQKHYIIIQSKEKLAMRKFFENGVEICELHEFIESLSLKIM